MESGSPKAVFLSYAREDTAAAQRIAEALRSHGVEVWFDQSELRGGDAWDQKIRRQIRECALFLPVISTQTQARHEGYFRREWKQAVERTHDMAEGVPFVLPVVIDDTRDAGAVVPGEFSRVQWIRLTGGLPTSPFVEQVKRLLAAPARSAFGPKAEPGVAPPFPVAKARSGFPTWISIALAALVVGLGGYVLLRPSVRDTPAAFLPAAAAAKPAPSVASPPVGDKSIAVLPFVNMSEDKNNGFFCDGIHEDILTDLSNIRELRVVSRTSVEQYRGSTKPIGQIAQELGVSFILEGSVQRSGNHVRVTGQLIDARGDRHLWAKSFDRDLTDVFAIQTELSTAIAGALEAKLSPAEQSLLDQRPTDNPVAYDLVLKARELRLHAANNVFHSVLRQERQQWFQTQIDLLREAIRIDPQYGVAYADLAYIQAFGNFAGFASWEGVAESRKAIDRAVQVAPDSPEVIRALGDYYYYGNLDYAKAMEQYARVLKIRPNDWEALARIAAIERRQGHWVESLAHFRDLAVRDPGNFRNISDLMILLAAGRRFDEAISVARALAERQPDNVQAGFDVANLAYLASGSTQEMDRFFGSLSPEVLISPAARILRIIWSIDTGDIDQGIRLYRESADRSESAVTEAVRSRMIVVLAARGDRAGVRALLGKSLGDDRTEAQDHVDSSYAFSGLAFDEAMLGEKDAALRAARRAVELMPETRDALESASARSYLAFAYAWTGEKDAAIAEYARLLRTPFASMNGAGGAIPEGTVNRMRRDPAFAPLRGDPRFEALLNDPKNNAPLF